MGRSPVSCVLLIVLGFSFVADAQQSVKPLAMTEDGVGAITKTTKGELRAVAKLFPQFNVVPGVVYSEGDANPTIRVMNGTIEVLYVVPSHDGTIYSVVVKSSLVLYGAKVKVGSLFADVFGGMLPSDCGMGHEELFEQVVCPAISDGHVRFVFTGKNDNRDERMPSLSSLLKWKVTMMWWNP